MRRMNDKKRRIVIAVIAAFLIFIMIFSVVAPFI